MTYGSGQGLREGGIRGTSYWGPVGTGSRENERSFSEIKTKNDSCRLSQLPV